MFGCGVVSYQPTPRYFPLFPRYFLVITIGGVGVGLWFFLALCGWCWLGWLRLVGVVGWEFFVFPRYFLRILFLRVEVLRSGGAVTHFAFVQIGPILALLVVGWIGIPQTRNVANLSHSWAIGG